MNNLKTVTGTALIVVGAVIMGLTANALSPNPLPLIRKPLRDSRRFIAREEASALIVRTTKSIGSSITTSKAKVSNTSPAPQAQRRSRIIEPISPVKRPAVSRSASKTSPNPKKIQALFTTLDDAKRLYDSKSAIFLDGRHPEDFAAEHISGAKCLYVEEIDKFYAVVLDGVSKDTTVVTYCSDDQCEMAIKLADALVARGYTKVLILLEGLPGWKNAHYPTTGAQE